MAGYVKIWTTLLDDPEFLSLSMGERGAYMQLIVAAKRGSDRGEVVVRNGAALGSLWGCDRKTCGKVLGKLAEKSLCTYLKTDDGVISISLPKYRYWQDLDVKALREKSGKFPAKIPPLRLEQSRLEQSRLEQSRPEHILSGKPDGANVDDDIPYSEIIEHLNQTTGQKYRTTTRKTRDLIKARWKEGFRLEDFKIVHVNKTEGWLHTDMAKFLRPDTLYSPKFEGYLNEIPKGNDILSNLSEAGRTTYLNAQKILAKDRENAERPKTQIP